MHAGERIAVRGMREIFGTIGSSGVSFSSQCIELFHQVHVLLRGEARGRIRRHGENGIAMVDGKLIFETFGARGPRAASPIVIKIGEVVDDIELLAFGELGGLIGFHASFGTGDGQEPR